MQLIETTPEYWKQKSERAARPRPAGPRARRGTTAGPGSRAGPTLVRRQLGLEPVEERPGGLRYVCSDTEFVVFASTGRASGDHTQMGLTVPDIDLAVDQLRQRSVEFDGDIVDVDGSYPSTGASGERGTWFRDSEGNLIGLGQYVY